MPSSSPDRSPPEVDADVVIVAVAARALAAAARRAGLRTLVLDLFADEDTRALAVRTIRLEGTGGLHFDAGELREALARHGQRLPLLLGTGFEDAPDLVDDLAARHPLLGCGGATIRRLKDPFVLAALCSDLHIPHPRVFADQAPNGVHALEKRIGASGGRHVHPAGHARKGRYLQEFVEGRAVSALLLGNGTGARLLAFSEQWCDPSDRATYRYGGAAGPIRLDPVLEAEIAQALDRLVAASGLRGLASADLIAEGDRWSLIEVNPRPGATLDIFDHPPLPPLLALHRDACAGHLPDLAILDPREAQARAAAVLYAPAAFEQRVPLPDWVADRPPPDTCFAPGDPVCTILATGRDVTEARANLSRRAMNLLECCRE